MQMHWISVMFHEMGDTYRAGEITLHISDIFEKKSIFYPFDC